MTSRTDPFRLRQLLTGEEPVADAPPQDAVEQLEELKMAVNGDKKL
jgi:hypothetical protein